MNEATLLIYHMNPAREAMLSALCRAHKIKPVHIPDSQGKVPIGLLTGAADPMKVIYESGLRLSKQTAGQLIDEEMIVMADFSESLFLSFLNELRQVSLRIDLKAVMTDENRYWNGEMLQKELKKERAAFLSARK